MIIKLNPILERFAERTPIPVMARGVLERCLNPPQLDAWFATVAEVQYTRRLLFSTVFDLMTQVVFRQQSSVHAAYQARIEAIGVSVTAVYDKLNGLELATTAGLVRYSAEQAGALIAEVGGARPGLLASWQLKVLDGNWLRGREDRLKELGTTSAAPLPGKSVAVFDSVSLRGCLHAGASLAPRGTDDGAGRRAVAGRPQLLHHGFYSRAGRARGGGAGARA